MKRKLAKKMSLILGISIASFVVGFSAITILVSRINYANYEKEYDDEVKEVENAKPKGPLYVDIDNEFVTYDSTGAFIQKTKSIYPYIYTCRSTEAESRAYAAGKNGYINVEIYDNTSFFGQSIGNIAPNGGGYLSFIVDVTEPADADIDFVCSSTIYNPETGSATDMKGLTKFVKWTINNIQIDADDINLPADRDWFNMQHVILHKVHLKAGINVIKMETENPNPLNPSDIPIPNISHIHVFSEKPYNKQFVVDGDSVHLVQRANKIYYMLSGSCVGYEADDFFVDMCLDGQSLNQINKNAYDCVVRDGYFLITIDTSWFAPNLYLPHFWLEGSLYNTGREQGDVMTSIDAGRYNWDNPHTKQTLGNARIDIKNSIMALVIS
ncbi:MAG: hypothetical protein IJ186_00360 [Bacilli bacterium]|nr:hypothetical protein [Bacilli bacterium]